MFELKKKLNELKTYCLLQVQQLFCHRMISAGLSVCHGAGCLITEKPYLYGPMALLYAIEALRG